jgi:diacylglycerol kinase family enzyme
VDGSVNEIAKGLLGMDTVLGILPTGSGNGLALHLGISKDLEKALDIIQQGRQERIDTVSINEDFALVP